MSAADNTGTPTDAFMHWCESCGLEELLDSERAHEAGWDFPPRMGTWGVVSPRTCPDCAMKSTAWWAIAVEKCGLDALPPHHQKTVLRISEEVRADTSES